MKHMRTVLIPAKSREFVDFVTCDLCGEKIRRENYEVDEVQIVHKIGENYPECGSGEDTGVDMCGKCFDEKLIPWLRSQGAEPRVDEWDW